MSLWETCLLDYDYEINQEYPYQIRRKDSGYILSEWFARNGYPRVRLNNKTYNKHRILAYQFLRNDDPINKTQVDHINKNRADYHLTNLRWVTPSQNQINKTSSKGIYYKYIDDLPLDNTPIIWYNGFEFDGYFMDRHGNIWFDTGVNFRKLYINHNNVVTLRDIYRKSHNFSIKGLRKEFL